MILLTQCQINVSIEYLFKIYIYFFFIATKLLCAKMSLRPKVSPCAKMSIFAKVTPCKVSPRA